MWNICGLSLKPGEKKQIFIEPAVKGYKIPTTLVCGVADGPVLLITAGIHSGEYPSIPAVIRTANQINPLLMTGNLILMHCVNTSGFWKRSPGVIPEDGFNLNHDYPGKPDGTTGERIADYFVRELFPKVDFILDLHSGGCMERMTSCVFFPRHPEVRESSLQAALAMDLPNILESDATTGEYSYAAHNFNVPGLLAEVGGCCCCDPEWMKMYEKNISLLMDHLGIYPLPTPQTLCRKTIYKKTIYLTSGEQGLWYPAIHESSSVQKGALLGYTEDFWGNRLHDYYAKADGQVFYYTAGLAVNQGSPLVAYGITETAVPV